MKFREITSRLTGISSPIFGVSWNPPPAEVTIARRAIAFLEDRRVPEVHGVRRRSRRDRGPLRVRSWTLGGWRFGAALGELRATFGLHIAKIATQNGLDVEDDLARILPASDVEDDDDPARKDARKKRGGRHD